MSTPHFALPFPVLNDVPNVPQDLQALAEATDSALYELTAGLKVAAGYRVAAADGSGVITVSFGVTFAADPVFMSGLGDSSPAAAVVTPLHSTLTPTGVDVIVKNASGAAVSGGTYRVVWIAVGT